MQKLSEAVQQARTGGNGHALVSLSARSSPGGRPLSWDLSTKQQTAKVRCTRHDDTKEMFAIR